MIINNDDIRLASIESRQFDDGLFPNWSDSDIWDGGFEEGVKFAENKLKDFFLKFTKYCLDNKHSIDTYTSYNLENYEKIKNYYDLEPLFKKFINDTIS